MMRQARGIEVLDIVFAKNGGAGVLRGRHLSLALRFSCFFHSAITFRWAMIWNAYVRFHPAKEFVTQLPSQQHALHPPETQEHFGLFQMVECILFVRRFSLQSWCFEVTVSLQQAFQP